MQVSDFLSEDAEPDNFLFVLSFTKYTNIGTELARFFYILTELARQKDMYKEKVYVHIKCNDILNKIFIIERRQLR